MSFLVIENRDAEIFALVFTYYLVSIIFGVTLSLFVIFSDSHVYLTMINAHVSNCIYILLILIGKIP